MVEGGRHGRARISREGGGDLYGAFASSRRPERICPLSRVPRPPTYFGLRPRGRPGGRHPLADGVVRGVHVRPRARLRDVHALRVQRDLRNRHDGLRRRGRHAGAVPRFDRDRWLSSRTVCGSPRADLRGGRLPRHADGPRRPDRPHRDPVRDGAPRHDRATGFRDEHLRAVGTRAGPGIHRVVHDRRGGGAVVPRDRLVFKSVPPASTNKAEWRAVLDAISAGQVVAELDLVATSDGHWMQNPARYRIDVAAWPLAVRPREASVQVDTLRPGGAIVLFAFDPRTMPINGSAQISVSANGKALNRSDDPLTLFYTFDSVARNASFTLLPLPGTVMAVYLPSLAAVSIDIVSLPPAAPAPAFDAGSEAAVIAALAIVSVAAARMLRRKPT